MQNSDHAFATGGSDAARAIVRDEALRFFAERNADAVTGRDIAAAAGAAMLRVRWFVRAPIWLYRARLGFLFGTRLLMLVHRGRTSGERRYVVLEVVARPTPDSYIVASGFGAKAQWYRNIVADPHVKIHLGSHRARPATARVLDQEHSSAALADYAAAHPRAWRTLRPVFETTLGAQIDDHATTLPLVALDLGSQSNDPH